MSSWTYSMAGVDLDKHRSMHRFVLSLIESLNKELGFEVSGIGGYTASVKYSGLNLSLHVDGVGTKTIVLQKLGKMRVAGWDCVAMNVNDVVCDGAKPIAVVDYIAMPKADEETFKDIVEGVVDAARVARIAVLGGETAILPDLANGVDVVCTVLAVRDSSFSNTTHIGDVVIGVSSWGLHANGYSLVRKVLESRNIGYSSTIDGINLADELAKPVAIYSNLVRDLIDQRLVTSVAHITGGAFTKLKRVTPPNVNMVLDMPKPPKIFEAIMELGNISVDEMYRVFNMGVGLILTASKENIHDIENIIKSHNFEFYELGRVVDGSGKVVLNTVYGKTIVF
ncbi:MAG: phosphoribosylformylglycinamidine cyclo-ligase [Ignisphaera sp.]